MQFKYEKYFKVSLTFYKFFESYNIFFVRATFLE